MEDSFLPYNLAISAYDLFFISVISRIFTFSLMERISRLLVGLEALHASLLLRFGAIITVHNGFCEHKHCDNAATNSNSENAGSRTVTSLRGGVDTGTKEEGSNTGRVWVAAFLAWRASWNLCTVYPLIFVNFFGPR